MLAVVIPAYKREQPLREALQSLVNQTYHKFFTIVVDDHSPVPLENVVKEFENSLHIHYIYAEENGGPGAARQIGLNLCYQNNIELVTFLDSDDKLFPHALERLTYEINHTRSDIVSASFWCEDGEGLGASQDAENATWMHGKIYRVSYLKEKNITFPKIRTNEDLAFNIVALALTEKKKSIKEVLYLFRHEKNSITRADEETLKPIISSDYISAIYYSTLKLQEHNCVNWQAVVNILSCYNNYQNQLCFNAPVEETKKQLKYLLSLPEVKQTLQRPTQMKRLTENFCQYCIIGKDIYFYKQTLQEWLEEFQ